MKTGLVLEGGAYRGIFTTGVLKTIRNHGIDFDYIVGVSAGAGNIVDFITGQDDISKNFIQRSKGKKSFGAKQFFKTGYFLNMDEMIKELMTFSDNEAAEKVMKSEKEIEIVCTNCLTARPEYMFDKKSLARLIAIGKASCSVPLISRPVVIGGTPYVDGSISDAIPLKHALEMKDCDKCLIILTRRSGETPTDYSKVKALINIEYHKDFPALEHLMMHRLEHYKKNVEYVDMMIREGRAMVIRPEIPSIKRFEKDNAKLMDFYIHGIDMAEQKIADLKKFLNQ